MGWKWILNSCWWECKLTKPMWKIVWLCLKKIKRDILYGSGILLLGTYPNNMENLIWKEVSIPMYIALFTIDKSQPNPNPLQQLNRETAEHMFNGILHSCENNKGMTFCTKRRWLCWVKSASMKDRFQMFSFICGIQTPKKQLNANRRNKNLTFAKKWQCLPEKIGW